jgi:hypothetical protein
LADALYPVLDQGEAGCLVIAPVDPNPFGKCGTCAHWGGKSGFMKWCALHGCVTESDHTCCDYTRAAPRCGTEEER